MNRLSLVRLGVVLACVAAAAGCNRRRSNTTIVNGGSDIFTTDEFPGAPVQDHNVADDKRALSPSGENFDSLNACVANGERGHLILVYQLDSGQAYAHHYDGSTFTPPAPLFAADMQPATTEFDFAIAFLNTGNHPVESARDRDGDAVVVWRATDFDGDGAADPDGENTCLYLTYFNVDHRDDPSRNFGFQAEGTRLNSDDMAGEDVRTVALVSDGLRGEARWQGQSSTYRWGDDVTDLQVVWMQREDNDGAPGFEDRALHARRIDPGVSVAGDLPLVDGAGIGPEARLAIDAMGASDSGTSSQESQIDSFLATYNHTVVFRVTARNVLAGTEDVGVELEDDMPGSVGTFNGVAASTDQVLQGLTFDPVSGIPTAPVVLHAVTPDATDALANDSSIIPRKGFFPSSGADLCYGSDEGLAALVFWSYELVQDADGAIDAVNSGRLALMEIDESTGALLSHTLVSPDDPMVDDTPVGSATRGALGRNGDFLVAVYVALDGDGASDDFAIFATSYVTTRIAEDGTLPPLPPTSSSLTPVLQVNADIDGSSCFYWAFQRDLGYVCGVQSDPDVVNIMFEHGDLTYDEIFVARFLSSPAIPASLSSIVTSVDVEDNDVGWRGSSLIGELNDDAQCWACIDSGEGGDVIVVYDKDVIPGAGEEHHLFARDMGAGGTSIRVDSGLDDHQTSNFVTIRLLATPRGESIGTFDPATGEDSEDRPRPAETVHAIFQESDFVPTPGFGRRLRTRRFDAGLSVSFGDAWTPPAGADFQPPFDLDLPNFVPTSANAAEVRGTFRCGRAVGVYFGEADRVYEQEFDPEAEPGEVGWHESGGVGDPFLVDDDTNEEVLFITSTCALRDACCDLPGAMVFWIKNFGGFSNERLQVRVRSDE